MFIVDSDETSMSSTFAIMTKVSSLSDFDKHAAEMMALKVDNVPVVQS